MRPERAREAHFSRPFGAHFHPSSNRWFAFASRRVTTGYHLAPLRGAASGGIFSQPLRSAKRDEGSGNHLPRLPGPSSRFALRRRSLDARILHRILVAMFGQPTQRFRDREDAGRVLAKALGHYARRPDVVLLAL